MSLKKLSILFLITIHSYLLFAQESSKSSNFRNEFGFQSDNDAYLFQGQDQYYTNGLFISYKQAIHPKNFKTAKLDNKIWDLEIAQLMFNPKSGYAPDPTKHDRPFAASLFASYALSNFYTNHSLFKWTIQGGTIGPKALGKEAQELLHQTAGFYEVKGWEYQIENAWLAQLKFDYFKEFTSLSHPKFNWGLGSAINLGTIHNNLNFHLLFRFGRIQALSQSSFFSSHLKHKDSPSSRLLESFFYLKPQLNFIATDATLQGNLFDNNSRITFKPQAWVTSAQIGYQFMVKRFRFDYHMIFNSKEVKSSALSHQYASVGIYYQFN